MKTSAIYVHKLQSQLSRTSLVHNSPDMDFFSQFVMFLSLSCQGLFVVRCIFHVQDCFYASHIFLLFKVLSYIIMHHDWVLFLKMVISVCIIIYHFSINIVDIALSVSECFELKQLPGIQICSVFLSLFWVLFISLQVYIHVYIFIYKCMCLLSNHMRLICM